MYAGEVIPKMALKARPVPPDLLSRTHRFSFVLTMTGISHHKEWPSHIGEEKKIRAFVEPLVSFDAVFQELPEYVFWWETFGWKYIKCTKQ